MALSLPGVRTAAAQANPSASQRPPILPLDEVRPGMKGVGRTVFEGSKIEEFDVEVLGVLKNIAPRQSVILARLSGETVERTGVMAGMSGSPVYVDGRLMGAVALAFQFSKEPIAGITPIEHMLDAEKESSGPALQATTETAGTAWTFRAGDDGETRLIPTGTPSLLPPFRSQPSRVFWGGAEASLERVATPLSLSGFTQEAIDRFQPQLRALGLIPVQGGSGGSGDDTMGDASALQPGSMISVQLVRGDMGVNADGTVTLVDGERVYAFGHRFLSSGPTEIPFSESQVITGLPGYASSMKISTPGRLLGVIDQDRSSGVFGTLGRRASMVPIDLEVVSSRQTSHSYHFEVVRDRFLLPLLVNLTVFSAIGATERMVGESTLQVEQTIALDGLPEVKLESFFSGDANAPAVAAQSAAVPLAYLMQSGLGGLDVRSIRLRVVSTDRRLSQKLDEAWSSRREVKPGETIEVTALLRGQDGTETLQRTKVEIPLSLGPGPLTITVADGNVMDRLEAGGRTARFQPKNPSQLVRAINKSRRNNRLYVRLARPGSGFRLQGESFPSPPPSMVRIFSPDPSRSADIAMTNLSTIEDYEMEPLPSVVSGLKVIRVNVKE